MTETLTHPRPLLTRPDWIDLNGRWEFCTDDRDEGVREGWWRGDTPFDHSIVVPFPPESAASGLSINSHAILWYRREIGVERPVAGRRLVLHFEAVDYVADVWVNGSHVAHHEGGDIGFAADVTDALRSDGRDVVIVRAFDDVTALEQPRGKQDWEAEPHVIWYRRTSGIWRQVWAEVVGDVHLERLRWTPRAIPGSVTAEAWITAPVSASGTDIEVEFDFSVDGRLLGRSRHLVREAQLRATLTLDDPLFSAEPERLLWSPEHPVLIDVVVRVLCDDHVTDEARSYIGLRTVAAEGGEVLLNGRPYFLRLVLEQAFWPQSHLAFPDDEAIRAEVLLIKNLGFNGLRMHQTVADPRFLYWCDRLGLVVWADAAAAYKFSALSFTRTSRYWTEIVERDASHPSIIAWVAFNESWGVPHLDGDEQQRDAVRSLYYAVKALDPSRLVIGNDGWEFVVGDMLGVHDYTQSPEDILRRYGTRESAARTVESGRPGGRRLALTDSWDAVETPIVLSEFGGVSFTESEQSWSGYGAVYDPDAFLSRLADLVRAAISADGLAGFCYTQLTDTLQEANGLLTEQRLPKADPAAIREIIISPRAR